MAYKIEIGVLNIRNYPTVARHFEEMASRGWLIHRVILEGIFIYKKISAEELDFSITPYEVETTFTKKRKADLKEFQSVCQSVGWNYASKSKDLHIYFKEKGSEAIELETDDEEEFKTIEKILKKQLIGMYFYLLIIIPVTLMYFFSLNSVMAMRDGLIQLIAPLFPIFIVLGISEIIKIKKFLKTNKHNIEVGSKIDYDNSKFYLEKAMYLLGILLFVTFTAYIVYVGIILKNTRVISSMLPFLLGTLIGITYGIIVKPGKTDTRVKVIILVLVIIGTIITINVTNVFGSENWLKKYNDIDINNYRVLRAKDFDDKETINVEDEGQILQEASLLVPKSYDYKYYNSQDRFVITEYSNVLNENLAKILVKRYIEQGKSELEIYEWELERAIEEGRPYNNTLEKNGLSLEEFNKLDKTILRNAIRDGMEIMKDNAISKDKENLWNLDEVYFLDYEKTLIVVRKGKEVFYLTGKDFSDPEIIEIVKERLDL